MCAYQSTFRRTTDILNIISENPDECISTRTIVVLSVGGAETTVGTHRHLAALCHVHGGVDTCLVVGVLSARRVRACVAADALWRICIKSHTVF